MAYKTFFIGSALGAILSVIFQDMFTNLQVR